MAVRLTIRSAAGQALGEPLTYDFEQSRIVLGRGAGADVRLPHATVSEKHALVRLEAEGYVLIDDESTNGTRCNGERLVPGRKKKLTEGDSIEIGIYTLRFEGGRSSIETVTAERTAELARRLFRLSQRGAQLAPPRIVVLSGPQTGKSVDLPAPPTRLTLGRSESCQLVLADPDVSREHAELVRDLDGVTVRNLESKNGIVFQGQRIEQRRLRDGDEITLGQTRLLFEEPAEEPLASLSREPDRTLPPPAPEPATRTTEVALEPELAPQPARQAPPPSRSVDADLLVYGLAAIVVAVSVAALVFLMRAG